MVFVPMAKAPTLSYDSLNLIHEFTIVYKSHVVNCLVFSHDLRLHSNRVLKVLAEKR